MNNSGEKLIELLQALSGKGTVELPGGIGMTVVGMSKSGKDDETPQRVEAKLRANGYGDNEMCQLGAVIKALHAWPAVQELDNCILHLAVHHDVLLAAELSNSLNQFMLRCGEELQKAEAVAGESCSPHRYTQEDYDNLKYNADKTAQILADCRAKHELAKSAAN